MISRLRTILLIFFVYAIPLQPLLVHIPSVQAADPTSDTAEVHADDSTCSEFAREMYDPASIDFIYPEDGSDTPTGFTEIVDLTALYKAAPSAITAGKITSRQYVDKAINAFGPKGMTYYKSPSTTKNDTPGDNEYLFVCDTAAQTIPADVFNPYNPIDPDVYDFISILSDPTPKIGFVKESDKWALLGERCEGGLIKTPSSEWTESTIPCPGFNATQDDKNGNGLWDAPKVDKRVLETLLYLVTPLNKGGAGREYIRVKKLVQSSSDNPLDQPVISPSATPLDDTSEAADIDALLAKTYQGDGGTTADDNSDIPTLSSAYYVDPTDPPHLPKRLSSAVMIDQIDRLRVSTKIEEKRLFGNNTITYKSQAPIPVNVAWQSDAGIAKSPPPDFSKLSMLESSRYLTNAAIVQLLSQNGLGDLEIDVSQTEFNNIGDVARVVGQSLLEQILGSPNGSMSGWNLTSVLRSIGLSALEQNLGLVPGSLADLNPLDAIDTTTNLTDITSNIGRTTIEYVLGFPRGALRTKTETSAEIMESVGRTYLENTVFQVRTGTLVSSDTAPLKTISDLLERLGEGRIEQVFKLPKQSLRASTYDAFRKSSLKASLLFPNLVGHTIDQKDYDMADYLGGSLSLSFVPYNETDATGKVIANGNTSMYGFTAGDFKFPTLNIDPQNPESLKKFKRIVGSRVIESSLGIFQRSGTTNSGLTTDSNLAPPSTVSSWNATIGGVPINPQFRPAFDGAIDKHTDWCDATSLTYATGKAAGGGGDAFTINGELDSNTVAAVIMKLQKEQGSLSGTWSTVKADSCSPNATINKDRLFTGLVNSVLFDTTRQDRTLFVNQDKAPVLSNFNPEDDPKGQGEDALYWRYNTATVLYYNLPENHQKTPLNYVPTFSSVTQNAQDANPTEKPADPKTVAEILGTLANGGAGDGDFTWPSDPALQQRLALIRQKQVTDEAAGTYDTSALLKQNLPAIQLDNALIDKFNGIAAQPAINKFEAQYNDPTFNGWMFMLQDLRSRLDCKMINGAFVFNTKLNSYSCVTTKDTVKPTAQAIKEVGAAKKIIDGLYKQPWVTAQSILSELKTHTYSDPSGYIGQSAMSVSVNLSSVGRNFDENNRLVKDTGCTTAEGCAYSRDIIRALVAPNGAGVVPLNTSIADFFTRGPDGRSLLGESGKQYAARKFSSDGLSQATFSSQIKTDFGSVINAGTDAANLFGLAHANAQKSGVDFASMEEKGLANDDFSRIFQLDEAKSVFERVGKDQLLLALWHKSGAATKLRTSEDFQNYLHLAAQVVNEVSFYTTRIDRIKSLSAQLDSKLDGINNTGLKQQIGILRDKLKTINNTTVSNAVHNKGDAEAITKSYEPTINQLRTSLDKTSGQADEAIAIVYEISHLTQEIISGRALPRDSKDTRINDNLRTNVGYTSPDGCYTKGILLDTLAGNGDINSRLVTLGERVGACTIETAFGVPSQTFYLWYKLGSTQFPPARAVYLETQDENGMPIPNPQLFIDKTKVSSPAAENLFEEKDGNLVPLVPVWNKNVWTKDNLTISTGIAYELANKSLTIDTSRVNEWLAEQTADTINNLKKEGERVLSTTLLVKLASMLPGVGKLFGKLGLTIEDVTAIFQGNTRPLTNKIGGGFLDHAFDLPTGTGGKILSPECFTNDGNPSACTRDPDQPGTNPDNMRAQTLASIGLQKLGLSVPNIPKNFNLLGKGNLAEGWGNAAITGDLGLAPNSFIGKITSGSYLSTKDDEAACALIALRCKNLVSVIMNGFGLSPTPFNQSLDRIKSAMSSAVLGKSTLAAPELVNSVLGTEIDLKVDAFNAQTALAHSTDAADVSGKKGYWTDFGTNLGLGTTVAQLADANRVSDADRAAYQKIIDDLWDMTTQTGYVTTGLTGELRVAILNNLPSEIKPSQEELSRYTDEPNILGSVGFFPFRLPALTGQYAVNYITYFRYFQLRLTQLDTQYNVGNKEFEQLMQGTLEAEKISAKVGIYQTANGILGKKIDDWIDTTGPSWLKTLNSSLKLVSEQKCPGTKDVGFGSLLTGAVTGTNNCTKKVMTFGTKDLLYSNTPEMNQMRGLLFDGFLSNVFSSELESDIGFRQGTFRRMAVSPSSARQILVTEGVYRLSDTIFGKSTTKDNYCQYGKDALNGKCASAVLMGILKDAFISGFCDDFVHDKCDTKFSNTRSIANFNKNVDEGIDRQLRRVGKEYLGTEITRKDVEIYNGNMSGIALIGIQAIANQMNKALFHGNAGSPMAKFYTTHFNDIRTLMGYNDPSTYEKLLAGGARLNTDIHSLMCGSIPDQRTAELCDDDSYESAGELYDKYKAKLIEGGMNATEAEDSVQKMKNTSFDAGVKDMEKERRQDAKNAVQYAMIDIIAFSRDKNIPPDFSRRILGKSGSDRAEALGEYIFTSILNSNSSLGSFLKTACAGSLDSVSCLKNFEELAKSLKSPEKMQNFFNSNSSFINLIDSGIDTWFTKSVGINLPAGTFSGIYVWGTHGFKASEFNTDGYCGGVSINSLAPGKHCETPIGIPVGRILQNAGEKGLENWADKAFGFNHGTTEKIVNLYKALQNPNKAKGAVDGAKIAADLLVGIFNKELSAFDTSVGLPQGTSAALATAGITYYASIAFGASAGAAQAAAFGPAFFIGLGLLLALGVVSVEVTSIGTADGYYPFYSNLNDLGGGEAGNKNLQYSEAYVHDAPSGEFDPTKPVQYHEGIKAAARSKVKGLITDILQMPYSDWAKAHISNLDVFRAQQIFTYGGPDAEYDPREDSLITEYIHRSLPGDPDHPGEYGYGTTDQSCESQSYDETTGKVTCILKSGYLIGLSGNVKLIDAIHVRW